MKTTRPLPDPIPFTQEAYDKIIQDIHRLSKERKEVLIRLQAAREMGDLSENGAYTYAKLELGSVSRQLRQLRHFEEYGVVTAQTSTATVGFGNSVTIESSKGKRITYTIVSIHESDLMAHKISTESPLGAALMGKKVGETATVIAPAGQSSFKIVEIA